MCTQSEKQKSRWTLVEKFKSWRFEGWPLIRAIASRSEEGPILETPALEFLLSAQLIDPNFRFLQLKLENRNTVRPCYDLAILAVSLQKS